MEPDNRREFLRTVSRTGSIGASHVNNFLECMRSRTRSHGDVLIGRSSAQAYHLGNLAYEQKRRIRFNTTREEVSPL